MSPRAETVAEFAARWLVPILFVFLIPVLAMGYAWDHNAKLRQYQSNVAACERVNTLTRKVNAKFAVYNKAFGSAALALKDSPTDVGKELHRVLDKAAVTEPDPLLLTDCVAAFDRPVWFWQ